jgi:hypothetical protein
MSQAMPDMPAHAISIPLDFKDNKIKESDLKAKLEEAIKGEK